MTFELFTNCSQYGSRLGGYFNSVLHKDLGFDPLIQCVLRDQKCGNYATTGRKKHALWEGAVLHQKAMPLPWIW